jgi:hypothetical protein
MQRRSKGLLVNLGQALLFVVAIVFALGWLVAPDVIAKQRDRVAAFVRLSPVRVSPPAPSSHQSLERTGLRQIAAHPS